MQAGYDPDRVRLLAARTAATIAHLSGIHCGDPAAGDALRAMRLLRRNLEDHWMPCLRQIQSSDAMTSWRTAGLDDLRQEWAATSAWLDFDEMGPNIYSELTEQELIDALTAASNVRHSPTWTERGTAVDPALTREIARRVAGDDAFADYLVRTADAHTVIGVMLGAGLFSPDFASAVTRTMITSPLVARDGLGSSFGFDTGAALDYLASAHPERCLELLGDRDVAERLVPDLSNRAIPSDSIENFTTSALAASTLVDERLLDPSYAALAQLIDIAGHRPVEVGVLRGVINSLVVHLPDMGHNLVEGSADVRPRGSAVPLGSYDDLQWFYGHAMGDPEAQAVAGSVLSGYLDHVLRRDGPSVLGRHADVGRGRDAAMLIGEIALPVSNAVDLLFVDGLATEQQRRNMLRGAAQAATDAWIRLFTAPTSVLIPALGAGRGVKTAFAVTKVGLDGAPGHSGDDVEDQGFRFTVPDQVRAAALQLVTASPELRTLAALDAVSDQGWSVILAVSARLATTTSVEDRTEALRGLDELDDVDRVTVDAFLDTAVSHSNADHNAE